jgi:hypothetical protein
MGTSKPAGEAPSLTDARDTEGRDQLILRRRSAQRAWRTARERADRAANHLRETQPGQSESAAARTSLEHARLAERAARAFYHRVADETGTLLSKLSRVADERITRARRTD